MKLSELKTKLCARELYMPDPEREADGGYCGDFLSFVMQRAPENSVWFTVMTNVNVCAVAVLCEGASLTGVAAVVVCESSKCDAQLVERIKKTEVALFETDLDIFGAVKAFLSVE